MREILDFSHTDKPIPQDTMNQAQNNAGNKNTNMQETKQDTKTPYSNWD
jgi:hypothetical protein